MYLQVARLNKALTQREVSVALNYSSAQFISNFERGLALPPLNKLKKLIKIYDLKVGDIIDRLTEDKRQSLIRALVRSG